MTKQEFEELGREPILALKTDPLQQMLKVILKDSEQELIYVTPIYGSNGAEDFWARYENLKILKA